MALTFNKSELDKNFEQFKEFKERMIERYIMAFCYVGEQFVNEAKSRNRIATQDPPYPHPKTGYYDLTANLRNSIGYVVSYDGRIVAEKFEATAEGTEGEKGVKEGKAFARSLIGNRMGLILEGIAGMEYAADLEAKGYDVISMTAMWAQVKLDERVKAITG